MAYETFRRNPDGTTRKKIPYSFLGSKRRTRQLLTAINEWRARGEPNPGPHSDRDKIGMRST
jgi:hypothetical protein